MRKINTNKIFLNVIFSMIALLFIYIGLIRAQQTVNKHFHPGRFGWIQMVKSLTTITLSLF